MKLLEHRVLIIVQTFHPDFSTTVVGEKIPIEIDLTTFQKLSNLTQGGIY
jgi:hypothetical protein